MAPEVSKCMKGMMKQNFRPSQSGVKLLTEIGGDKTPNTEFLKYMAEFNEAKQET